MELSADDIAALFAMRGDLDIAVDIDSGKVLATSTDADQDDLECSFSLNEYDKNLVSAGGWLAFAEANY